MLVAIRLWRQEVTLIGKLMAFQDAGGSLGMLGQWAEGTEKGRPSPPGSWSVCTPAATSPRLWPLDCLYVRRVSGLLG